MLKKLLISLFCIFLPMHLLADELTLNENAPKSYVVKKGDTLWDISGVFLKQPWLWPKLWRMNPEIDNPHLIYPGDELRLVYDAKGQPMLVKGKPTLKWSPRTRTSLKNQSPVQTLPFNIVAPYMRYENLFTEAQLNDMPYIVGSDNGYKSSVDGFKIYVNGEVEVDRAYGIYEKGEAIVDPDTLETIGYYAKLIGTAQAVRNGEPEQKKPSTLYVDNARREIRSGFVIAPVNDDQMFPSYFAMQAAQHDVRGKIIKASSGQREFGKFEVVMLNKGATDSLKLGDVLAINRKSPGVLETEHGPVYTSDASRWNRLANVEASDYDMPEETIGNVMVFKVYQELSMAIVLGSSKPVRLDDAIATP